MSKQDLNINFDIRPQFECKNRMMNVKFNAIFEPNSNVKKQKAKNEKRKNKSEKRTSFILLIFKEFFSAQSKAFGNPRIRRNRNSLDNSVESGLFA